MRLVFRILILLLPTQLAIHLWPSWAHIFGLRIDYFSPNFYLTDGLVLLLITIYLWKQSGEVKTLLSRYKWQLLFIIIFSLFNIVVSQNWHLGAVKWLKVYELISLCVIVSKLPLKWDKDILVPFSLSLTFVSLIGIAQFLKGATLNGIFYVLGERQFSIYTPGIALFRIQGIDHLRVYSVFPHPNALAGYFVVMLFLLILSWSKDRMKHLKWVVVILSLTTIILANSLGAFIALMLGEAVYLIASRKWKWFQKIVYVLMAFMIVVGLHVSQISQKLLELNDSFPKELYERLWLNVAAGNIIKNHLVTGVGLNNFILFLSKSDIPLKVITNYQPVHNILLLVLTECGLIGLLGFIYIIFKSIKYSLEIRNLKFVIAILAILLTGLVDHYWLTLQQNLLLFAVVLGLTFNKSEV